MDGAERRIQRLLQEASTYRDLSSALDLQRSPAVSGNSPADYPLQPPYVLSVSPTLPVVSAVHTVPLPDEILDNVDFVENCHYMMGVFPEISQAWLTINSDLFLWDFQTGRNVTRYDGLRDPILCVGLVRPEEGLLQPHTSYLLVIATPVTLVMLGVSVSSQQSEDPHDRPSGKYQLLLEPLYSVAADDTYVSVAGTHNGRIFLSGTSGCLHEVVYRAKAGWLSPKCRTTNRTRSAVGELLASWRVTTPDPIVQIAVDDSRNILYTRSENGVLEVYDLGPDGSGINKVASVSEDAIVCDAVRTARTADTSLFRPIIQIAVINKSESVNCGLVAITGAGVRLYFTSAPAEGSTDEPWRLSLLHIRLPPGFLEAATVNKPSSVHKAFYSDGVFLMAASKDATYDLLWCVKHNCVPSQKQLMETHAVKHLSGHSCVIAPVKDSSVGPEQHRVPAKTFVVLSAHGSQIFSMLKPVEQLQDLLSSTYEDEDEQVLKPFFKVYHPDQACAASVRLACSTAASDWKLFTWATEAFFRYGGMCLRKRSQVPNSSFRGSAERHLDSPGVIFSAGQNGIYVHFASIIHHIWDKEVLVERTFKNKSYDFTQMESGVSGPKLQSVLRDLRRLEEFLDRNFNFGRGSIRDVKTRYESTIPRGNRITTGTRQKLNNSSGKNVTFLKRDINNRYHQEPHDECHSEAQLTEKTSLQGIHQLVKTTCQTLEVWNQFCQLRCHQLVSGLRKELQEQLKKMTFKDLVIRGKMLTKALIASLIDYHMRHNGRTDEVISYLQRTCPIFYSGEDSIFSKAHVLIQTSLQANSEHDKEQLLRASLQEYQKVCHLLDLDSVCSKYRQHCFYEGVVQLCLTYAGDKDPQGLGLRYLKNGKPEEDELGSEAFETRMHSYDIIIDLLQELVTGMKSAPRRVTTKQDPSGLPFHQILELVQRSSDEFLHIVLFNWLIKVDLTDVLLGLKSPFLELHLMRMSNRDDSPVRYVNLLFRFYYQKASPIKAARVMAKRADYKSTAISLKTRIEYLSRAILCARTTNGQYVHTEDSEFIHELEDAMDVAKVQLEIQKVMIREYSHHPSARNAVAHLDSELFGLTDLYEKFADPFQLSECKLAILRCASFSNANLVQQIWKDIIETELKKSVEMDAADRMRLLNLKLILLGKIYASTPMYLPLQFLVQYLEQKVFSLDWQVDFVYKTMLEMNVPVPTLLAVYDHLFRIRHPFWTEVKKPLHLLECIHALLSGYENGSFTVPSHERQQFNATCVNDISSYLVELQLMDPNPALKTFFWTFTHLKTRLEQLPVTS